MNKLVVLFLIVCNVGVFCFDDDDETEDILLTPRDCEGNHACHLEVGYVSHRTPLPVIHQPKRLCKCRRQSSDQVPMHSPDKTVNFITRDYFPGHPVSDGNVTFCKSRFTKNVCGINETAFRTYSFDNLPFEVDAFRCWCPLNTVILKSILYADDGFQYNNYICIESMSPCNMDDVCIRRYANKIQYQCLCRAPKTCLMPDKPTESYVVARCR